MDREVANCSLSKFTRHSMVWTNSVTIFSCVMRGLKIILSLTLTGVKIHHTGVNICLCGADGLHQRRQVLMHVRDG